MLDGLITWDIIEGSVTSERFMQFLQENVVCGILYQALYKSCNVYRYPSPILIGKTKQREQRAGGEGGTHGI